MKKLFTLALTSAICTAAYAQSIYGDMETWRTYTTGLGATTVMNPKGWFTTDSLIFTVGPVVDAGGKFNMQVTQSSDAHGGNYSAKVMSRVQGTGGALGTFGVAPGVLTNSQPEFNSAKFSSTNPYAALYYVGGLSTTTHYKVLTAWVKYLPKGIDNGSIVVEHLIPGAGAGGSDSLVGWGYVVINSPVTTWTRISVDIAYATPANPTQLRMFFFSSDPYGTVAAVDSSTMYVDDVALSTTDVPSVSAANDVVNVYPNPSVGTVYLHSFTGEQLTWTAFNINGQVVARKTFSGRESVNLSDVASGMYFYNIANSNGETIQHGKFTIAR
ncbi:MAG: T9SS type A sorting domain-containing protein [Bacteroidetes bacterium]|nr:T9SS type A sorting domain-containing protein [Bacteroidota bacterium]